MIIRKRPSGAAFAAAILILMTLLPACRLHRLERKLDAESARFLSEVRYIISSEERKIFLELPAADREAFIKEFWKRRDPDPETEENLFKQEYFARVERANRIFPGEGRPGWLTDRGRIYVLFGPPLDRITNPVFETSARCSEVWYYGDFPVVFVDHHCRGEFRLVTYDLTSLRDHNLAYMHDLNLAQIMAQQTYSLESPMFDFAWRLKKSSITPSRMESAVLLEIRYADIWLESSGDRLETALDVHLELKDPEGMTIWERRDSFEVSLTDEELKQKRSAKLSWEIPIVLESELDRLVEGRGALHIHVRNRTGGAELRKVMDFTR